MASWWTCLTRSHQVGSVRKAVTGTVWWRGRCLVAGPSDHRSWSIVFASVWSAVHHPSRLQEPELQPAEPLAMPRVPGIPWLQFPETGNSGRREWFQKGRCCVLTPRPQIFFHTVTIIVQMSSVQSKTVKEEKHTPLHIEHCFSVNPLGVYSGHAKFTSRLVWRISRRENFCPFLNISRQIYLGRFLQNPFVSHYSSDILPYRSRAWQRCETNH